VQVTHFGHACVLVETDRARILFDPGMFSSGFDELADVSAVLVTHQHPDHIDEEKVATLLRNSPDASLIVDPGTAVACCRFTDRYQVVQRGETLQLAGSKLAAIGGEHAVIHSDVPSIPNIGFVLDDGAFYHPGDALVVPEQDIDVLGMPIAAPWLKAAEVVDFERKVMPRVAIPIHEAVLAEPGLQWPLYQSLGPVGTTFTALEHAVVTDI
jgi:L-ascorbate metabolism protein UlaG (beta-lactamase superfamily)